MRIEDIDTPPLEPVELGYAKTFLRVDTDDEDALITDMIRAGRERVESLTASSLIMRRRLYVSDAVAQPHLFINHTPVSAVLAVSVVNHAGVATEIALSDLDINLRSQPAAISLKSGECFTDKGENICAAEIEIDAGYGAGVDDVPMPLRQAILLLVADGYEHRDQVGGRPAVPMMVDALLMPYRSLRL